MKTIFICICIFFLIALVFHLLTKKFVSPYTFTIAFGKKGVGKSCTMQKDLRKHYKKGWVCYADSSTDLPFVKRINAKQIYDIKFPRGSFVAIDEINLLWDNRDHKQFDQRVQKFFREQRKHGVKIYAYSQTFDCDKKLRDLCDRLALQRKFLRIFSVRRYYIKGPKIISARDARDHARAVDDLLKVPIIFGGVDFCYIPRYIKDYDTNEIHGEKVTPMPAKPTIKPLVNVGAGILGGEAVNTPPSADGEGNASPAGTTAHQLK